jgi:hypothetical protein
MSASSYAVPVAAVSHGADFAGKITFAQLVAEGVSLHSAAVVELGPQGWVATVLYTAPGQPARQQVAHVGLLWPPELPHQQGAAHAG